MKKHSRASADVGRTRSSAIRKRKNVVKREPIPEPLQFVRETLRDADDRKIKLPTLILRGEWLKAAGFPIGAPAYLTTDERGEVAMHRLGLGFPRRLRIRATPR